MSKKWTPQINKDELDWLFQQGLVIRSEYISPFEGWEFNLVPIGKDFYSIIKTKKSERACYNYAKRNIDAIKKAMERRESMKSLYVWLKPLIEEEIEKAKASKSETL